MKTLARSTFKRATGWCNNKFKLKRHMGEKSDDKEQMFYLLSPICLVSCSYLEPTLKITVIDLLHNISTQKYR